MYPGINLDSTASLDVKIPNLLSNIMQLYDLQVWAASKMWQFFY